MSMMIAKEQAQQCYPKHFLNVGVKFTSWK